ncbi:hypothetical protein BT63DRAFT_430454 [Microthyrium microscopicum]|uniref:Uncharacterized protein n=1 Tax=Microthyrium microscopicum TaxID=703497 RepID=A0A6A6TT79_9PEZI|nr:hypothetical protein BT63DRAFT_430454 [Microthyrium microscopicum]
MMFSLDLPASLSLEHNLDANLTLNQYIWGLIQLAAWFLKVWLFSFIPLMALLFLGILAMAWILRVLFLALPGSLQRLQQLDIEKNQGDASWKRCERDATPWMTRS